MMFGYGGMHSREELQSILSDTVRAADQLLTQSGDLSHESRSELKTKLIALGTTVHAKKIGAAVHRLVEAQLSAQALMLIRPLWESLVNLNFVLQFPEVRAHLFFDHFHVGRRRLLDRARGAKGKDRPNELLRNAKFIEEVDSEFEAVRYNYPSKDSWSGFSTEQMADAVGLGGQYLRYFSILSGYVHSSLGVLQTYFDFDPSNPDVALVSRTVDRSREASSATSMFLVEICDLHAGVFGLESVGFNDIKTRLAAGVRDAAEGRRANSGGATGEG